MGIKIDFDKLEIRVLQTCLSYIKLSEVNLNHKEKVDKEYLDRLYLKLSDALLEIPQDNIKEKQNE